MRENSEKGKLFFLLFIIAGFIILVFVLTRTIPPTLYTPIKIKSLLSTVSVVIPDTDTSVDLSDGSSTFEIDGIEGSVVISEPYLSVKTATGYDLFAVMTYNMGGSSDFVAIAMFQERSGITIYRNSYPLENWVVVNELLGPVPEQEGAYTISVNYLDRELEEPMPEPSSVEKSIELQIVNNRIVPPTEQ